MLQEIKLVLDNTQKTGPRIGIGYSVVGEAMKTVESHVMPTGAFKASTSTLY